MYVDLPLQAHIPEDRNGSDHVGVPLELVRALGSWQQLSNAALPMIHQLSRLIHHLQQLRGPIVVGFNLQISGLYVSHTMQPNSLESTAQPSDQLSLGIHGYTPTNREPVIWFHLAGWDHRILFMLQKEWGMPVRMTCAQPEASQHLRNPIPPKRARMHANILVDSRFNHPAKPFDLPISAGIARRSLANSHPPRCKQRCEDPLKLLAHGPTVISHSGARSVERTRPPSPAISSKDAR